MRAAPSKVVTWLYESLCGVVIAIRLFRARGWLLAAGGATVTAVLIGIPTDLVPNDWYVRMTPARPQDYIIWVTTALILGLVAGTFTLPYVQREGQACAMSGGLLSFLAVGCAICNKLVVLLLGTAGGLTFFAPLQLYVGIASIATLAWTLRIRSGLVAAPRTGRVVNLTRSGKEPT